MPAEDFERFDAASGQLLNEWNYLVYVTNPREENETRLGQDQGTGGRFDGHPGQHRRQDFRDPWCTVPGREWLRHFACQVLDSLSKALSGILHGKLCQRPRILLGAFCRSIEPRTAALVRGAYRHTDSVQSPV